MSKVQFFTFWLSLVRTFCGIYLRL